MIHYNLRKNKQESHMKNKIAVCLLGLMSLGVTTFALAQQAVEPAEKTVAALEDQWTQSQKTNNPAKNLADAKATKFSSVDIEDLHITVVGHTAIAVMVFKAKGTDEKGKPMDINARWVDTWVKMPSGAWQCVLSQGSSLKP